MDMDKIITDLVNARFRENLGIAISAEINGDMNQGSVLSYKLKEHINGIMDEILEERKDEIKAILRKAVDEAVIKSDPILSFDYKLQMNMPRYKIEEILRRVKE